MAKKILYIDMDGTIFEWPLDYILHQNPEMYVKGFFEQMEPKENAIKVIHKILKTKKYDVYILTKPVYNWALSYSEKVMSILKWLPSLRNKIIMTQNKGLFRKGVLIDDEIRYKKDFKGKFIHFKSWAQIEKELKL